MNFREWANTQKKDIFGFNRRKAVEKKEYQDEMPIDPIDSEIIMKELSLLPLGVKHPTWDWHDRIAWGNQGIPGAMMVEISPLGSLKATMRKLIFDLEGTETWICKRIFDMNGHGYNKNEEKLALDIYEELIDVDMDNESPNAAFEDKFQNLVFRISGRLRREHPTIMLFDKVKKIKENYYICSFNIRGQGMETHRSGGACRIETFHINFNFDKKRGLVRVWGNEIVSPTREHKWIPSPSEWDEYFAPTQRMEEIEDAVVNMLMSY